VPDYIPRLVDGVLDRLLAELPGVLLVGPRATGKTTTGMRFARTVVRLDNPREADAFRADPDAALRGLPQPVLIDEWQLVPDVLGALKRAIDVDPRPGRFLVTGSVRTDLEAPGWPATGRLTRVPIYGMTVRERMGRLTASTFLDRIGAGEALAELSPAPDLRDYVEIALHGGYPELALHLTPATRQAWIDSYVEQVLTRDATEIDPGRDPVRVRQYLEAYALNSGGLVHDSTLWRAAGINRRTAQAYDRLLVNLLVIENLPAWTANRLHRLTQSPKRYLVDPALLTGILHVDAAAVLRDGDLLGRVLDTFVVAQLRAELSASARRPRLYHVREEHGRHEVDLLVEYGGRDIVAFEIKATGAPGREGARHLTWLRDQLGERFLAGIVFHTGPRIFTMGERIMAVPICAMWA
jgi:predicted AAA+ superfamily ATPase